ncbi:ABC transporter ATP-binding protein [Algihabitans albus]|uniref:ABC transporter ATP-binding protein n=1 Tax=Algihabitans albus TaxID=2164067 RepID=UPI0035D12888
MSSDPILSVERIDVFYGASKILFGVDIAVGHGRTLALLGRNGAGKSTTLKAIAGLAPPKQGRVVLRGQDMAGSKPYVIARAGIGYVPEDRQVFPEHSVEDNLLIGAKRGRDSEGFWTLGQMYEVFPILAGMRDRRAGALSGGEQQMLTIARTLMGNPEVLLLDEPSEGLAPIIVQAIGDLIRKLRSMGVTILLAEQNMHFCLGISEDAVVIDKGSVVFSGAIQELRENHEVTRRYLAI